MADARAGFTLIEMLITIVLITIVTGIVYASLSSVADSTDVARVAAEEMRLRQFLTRHFERNLAQCYADWQPGASLRDPEAELQAQIQDNTSDAPIEEEELLAETFWLEGVDDTGPQGPADSLSFATTTSITGGSALPGVIKQVTYEVVDRSDLDETLQFLEDESRSLALQCREVPIFDLASLDEDSLDDFGSREDFLDEQEFETAGWSVPISTLDLQYFDGEEWVDDWDSIDEGRLPWAVRVRINFARGPDEEPVSFDAIENPDFSLIVSLPGGMGLTEPPLEPVHRLDENFQNPGGAGRIPEQPQEEAADEDN